MYDKKVRNIYTVQLNGHERRTHSVESNRARQETNFRTVNQHLEETTVVLRRGHTQRRHANLVMQLHCAELGLRCIS